MGAFDIFSLSMAASHRQLISLAARSCFQMTGPESHLWTLFRYPAALPKSLHLCQGKSPSPLQLNLMAVMTSFVISPCRTARMNRSEKTINISRAQIRMRNERPLHNNRFNRSRGPRGF